MFSVQTTAVLLGLWNTVVLPAVIAIATSACVYARFKIADLTKIAEAKSAALALLKEENAKAARELREEQRSDEKEDRQLKREQERVKVRRKEDDPLFNPSITKEDVADFMGTMDYRSGSDRRVNVKEPDKQAGSIK